MNTAPGINIGNVRSLVNLEIIKLENVLVKSANAFQIPYVYIPYITLKSIDF